MVELISSKMVLWTLLIVFVLIFVFGFYNSKTGFISKFMGIALGAERLLPIEPIKELRPEDSLPQPLMDAQKAFMDDISKYPGQEKCLLSFNPISGLGDFTMTLSNYEGKIISRIGKPIAGGGTRNLNPVEADSLQVCVIDSGAFYDCYVGSQQSRCAKLYNTPVSVEITKDSLTINGKAYSLAQNLLFKPEKDKVCLIPSSKSLFGSLLGCSKNSDTIDDRCMEKIKSAIPECKKEQDWAKILQDYEKNKCSLDKYTCRAESLPCQCFSVGSKIRKEAPRVCDDSHPYCYEGSEGCNENGPDFGNKLQLCKEALNENFILAPACEVSDYTCQVRNAPCSCNTKDSKSSGRLPKVCLAEQYCYDGQIGCSQQGPDITSHADYCKASNPKFKLDEIPQCIVDSKCKSANAPCKCSSAGGKYQICLEKGNNYCHENNVGCNKAEC